MATLDVGSIAVQDIAGGKQDVEYHVIVHRGGAEVAKLVSKASFSQQADGITPRLHLE